MSIYSLACRELLPLKPDMIKLIGKKTTKTTVRHALRDCVHKVRNAVIRQAVFDTYIDGNSSLSKRNFPDETKKEIRRALATVTFTGHPNYYCRHCGVFFGDKRGVGSHGLNLKPAHRFCGQKCARNSDLVRNKIKKTSLGRYGTDSPISSRSVRMKAAETIRERYGVDNVSQSEFFKKAKAETTMRNHGVTCALVSGKLRERGRETLRLRYGVDSPMQSEEIRGRARETNITRYGVDNPSKSPEIIQKIVDAYNMKTPEEQQAIRDRITETTVRRYGVENAMQSKEVSSRVSATWRAKTDSDLVAIRNKKAERCLVKHGVRHHFQIGEVLDKAHRSARAFKSATVKGKRFDYLQGWEDKAIKFLAERGVNIGKLKNRRKDVGGFPYKIKGDPDIHMYFPDFKTSTGTLVEMKSDYTAGLTGPNKDVSVLRSKMRGVEDAGQRIYTIIRTKNDHWVVIPNSRFTLRQVMSTLNKAIKSPLTELVLQVGCPAPLHSRP